MEPIHKDHAKDGLSRIASQFQNATRFQKYLESLLKPFNELEDVLFSMGQQVLISSAQGKNLDVLGRIVGQTRIVNEPIDLYYFGFYGLDNALPFGEEGKPNTGGAFYNDGGVTKRSQVLPDSLYRLVLRAGIARNISLSTNEDILQALQFVLGDVPLVIEDFGDMEISLSIGSLLSLEERSFLKNIRIIPKPMGVTFTLGVCFDQNDYFGFLGQNNARGMGEEGVSGVGGIFANTI